MAVTIFKSFKKVVRFANLIAKVCGANMVDENYHINIITCFVVIFAFFFFICTGYTIYVGVIIEGDWTVILQSLCMAGSAVQGLTKLFSLMYRRPLLVHLVKVLEKIYDTFQHRHNGYKLILNKAIKRLTNMLKIVSGVYISVSVILLAYPLIVAITTKKKVFIMQFLLPGIDHTTEIGYIIHLIAHTFGVGIGAFGNFAGDLYLFILTANITMIKDILRTKFTDLKSLLSKPTSEENVQKSIIDIIRWHQQYTSFTVGTQELFGFIITVEIVTISANICFTLFCLILGTWPAGAGFFLYCTFILYTYCGLGTIVEVANDDLLYAMYEDIPWYSLPNKQQKMLVLMIMNAQSPIVLTVGSVIPLSVATALQLSKAIYSYMMMLLNFVE